MRVRGSLLLKFAAPLREKGSALIDTDSTAMARVEVEVLNNTGLRSAPDALVKPPQTSAARPAHTTELRRLRGANDRFLI